MAIDGEQSLRTKLFCQKLSDSLTGPDRRWWSRPHFLAEKFEYGSKMTCK